VVLQAHLVQQEPVGRRVLQEQQVRQEQVEHQVQLGQVVLVELVE